MLGPCIGFSVGLTAVSPVTPPKPAPKTGKNKRPAAGKPVLAVCIFTTNGGKVPCAGSKKWDTTCLAILVA